MTKITVGTKVKLRGDVLIRHSRSVPAQAGFTHEQFAWRDTLNKLAGKIGTVTRVFPDSKSVNVDFDGHLIGIDSTELLVKSGKGWKEAADASGKAPRHKAAATRHKVSGVSKVPMVRKHEHQWEGCDDLVFTKGKNKGSSADVFCTTTKCDKGGFTDEQGKVIPHSITTVGFEEDKEKDWRKVAKKELEKELGVKTKLSAYGNDDEFQLTLESTTGKGSNGEREWTVFKNEDEARSAAKAQVKQDLENEPGIFTQSWLQKFITISDTDKRIIAGEEADSQIEDMDDKELLKEAGMDEEWNDLQVKMDELFESDSEDVEGKLDGIREKQDELVEKAKDSLRSSKSDQIQDALEDPVEYFVEQQGIYSREDLMKQSFIQIDIDKAAEDAIDTDGVSHFLDRYDGSELELPSGALAYGTN